MPVTQIESIAALRDHVGREVAVSDWLAVSQERINQFAEKRFRFGGKPHDLETIFAV